MACGQKKQTNQGGVHLTERTCSPYNPIIKQIVDDCLGLPIYPVTSVDAIIDEDGNTLRRLFEKLLEDIKTENGHAEEILDDIENAILDLDDVYTKKEDFATLKALVWAISSMATEPYEQNLYSNGVPTIVAKIRELENLIEHIDVPEDLLQSINTLSEILFGIANYNINYPVDNTNELVLQDGKIAIIKEIIDIKARLDTLENSDINWDEVEPDASGNIVEKIKYLLVQIRKLVPAFDSLVVSVREIIQATRSYAHLDETVLQQVPTLLGAGLSGGFLPGYNDGKIPDLDPTSEPGGSSTVIPGGTTVDPEDVPTVNPGTSTDNPTEEPTEEPTDDQSNSGIPSIHDVSTIPEEYAKLKASEYPVTSFIMPGIGQNWQNEFLDITKDRYVYIGASSEVELDGECTDAYKILASLDVYPLRISNSGLQIYTKSVTNDNKEIVTFTKLTAGTNRYVTAGDNYVDLQDLASIIKIIMADATILPEGVELEPFTSRSLYINPCNVITDDTTTYPKTSDEILNFILLGSGDDGEVNIRDINIIINRYLKGQSLIDIAEEITTSGKTITGWASGKEDYLSEEALPCYIAFYPSGSDKPLVKYPCIDGKLYTEYLTNTIYRFSQGESRMVEVFNDAMLGKSIKSNLSKIDCDVPYLFGPCVSEPSVTEMYDSETGYINATFLHNPFSVTIEDLDESIITDLSDFNLANYFLLKLEAKAEENREEVGSILFDESKETHTMKLDNILVLDYHDGKAVVYTVEPTITYVAVEGNLPNYYIIFTVENGISALYNRIYSFNDYGLEIRFGVDEEENYTPIVVSTETSKLNVNITEAETPIKVKCNKFLNITSTQPITFDANEFTLIPGHEVIEVKGRFSSSDNTAITVVPNEILLNGNNPSLVADNVYEFSILDGVLSYKDVTPVLI